MREEFLVFGAPQIEEVDIDEVVSALRSGWIGSGPRVAEFQEDFASYKGAPFAAALNSATAGLHLACKALGLGEDDEVVTTPMTFCATINAILHSGATPILADIDPTTMNIDPASIESVLTPRTKAILPVHFAGRPCEMDRIMEIANRHGLRVIEDCAHAIEAEYKGRKTGTFGNIGVFSFYVTKNVITGEGGMVISKDQDLVERINVLALHGMSRHAWQRFSDQGFKHYFVEELGYKYNMTDLQAALGIHQLKRVEKNWARRREIWQRYMEAFADLPLGSPATVPDDVRHAYHLFQIMIDQERVGISRNAFLDEMTARRIGVGVHYLSMPEHPYYQEQFGWRAEHYPHAHDVGQKTVSLPLSPVLTEDDVDDVICAVRDVIAGAAR